MKHIKHLFAVCLFLLVATTAMAQSQSDNTQTKAVSAAKADVNGDGVVNEADIEEIIAIMQQENGTKYYWYAGWTEPTETNIWEIINEEYPVSKTDTTTSKAGGYKNTNQGFDVNNFFAEIITNRHNIADTNRENSGQNTNYYIVVPNNMGIYSSNAPTMSALATFTLHKTFDNHIVYKSIDTSRNLGSLVIY